MSHKIAMPEQLTFDTVPNALEALKKQFKEHTSVELSFASVQHIDSSSIALMLALLRYAEKHKMQLAFSHPSPQLLKIIRVGGLESMIPFVSE